MSGSVQGLLAAALPNSNLSFLAAGAVGTGAFATLALPAGIAAGDFLFCVVSNATTVSATPAGWSTTNSNAGILHSFYKVASGSDTNPTITNTASASVGVIVAWRGNNATPIDVQMTANNGTATTSSITTTSVNDYVISVYQSSVTVNTWTPPASTTARVTFNPTGSVRGLLVVDELQVASGASSTRTASGPSISNCFALAIKV